MKVYKIYYDLYYEGIKSSKSGSYLMYADNIRKIFDRAFDQINENEVEYEKREFMEAEP